MATRRRAASLAAPPDRTAGLDDLGTPPPRPAGGGAAPEATPEPTDPARPRRARPTTAATARRTRPISARIPAPLFEAVQQARAETGETHEMWFLAALDAVWDELVGQYPAAAQQRSGSRVPLRTRRVRRPTGEPLVQYPLRLTPEERAALDDRYRTCRPPSLADLVTTVVRLRLAQHGG